MGKKIARAPKKHEKRVVIGEVEKEPNKPTSNPNTEKSPEPLKSALKKTKEQSVTEENDLVFLDGFEEEDSGSDSSDDDSGNESKKHPTFDSKDLPPSKISHKAQNDKSSKQQKMEARSGVIYLGRIPHGFYEEEMKGYFNQFGEVTRLRLSRCKRTGKPKHYGFIEFKHHQVAQIVAETLNNYLLCGTLLQCKLLDQDQIHPKLWVGAGLKFRKDVKSRARREKRNQPKSVEQQEVISNRLIEREEKKRKRLTELGIDYDFPGYVNANKSKPVEKETVVGETKNKKKHKIDNNKVVGGSKSAIPKKRAKKSVSSTGP